MEERNTLEPREARRRDGRSARANLLTQIAGQHALLGRQPHRGDIGIDGIEPIGLRLLVELRPRQGSRGEIGRRGEAALLAEERIELVGHGSGD